jgi:hypothetical protein
MANMRLISRRGPDRGNCFAAAPCSAAAYTRKQARRATHEYPQGVVLDQPGIFEKRCVSPPSCTHRCALSQKSCIAGFTQLESSSVPE